MQMDDLAAGRTHGQVGQQPYNMGYKAMYVLLLATIIYYIICLMCVFTHMCTFSENKVDGTTYEFNQTASISASSTSFGFAAKPKFEISDGVMLYGKLGVHNWKSELSISSTDTTASADDDGTDVFYGAGIQVSLENLNGRVGYSKFDLDGDYVNSINLGLSYSF